MASLTAALGCSGARRLPRPSRRGARRTPPRLPAPGLGAGARPSPRRRRRVRSPRAGRARPASPRLGACARRSRGRLRSPSALRSGRSGLLSSSSSARRSWSSGWSWRSWFASAPCPSPFAGNDPSLGRPRRRAPTVPRRPRRVDRLRLRSLVGGRAAQERRSLPRCAREEAGGLRFPAPLSRPSTSSRTAAFIRATSSRSGMRSRR